ncbi:MAG: cysteine desulfurase [Vicingaceae bacterium]
MLDTKTFDITTIRKQFPILTRKVYDKPLIYFDNSATAQKPQMVIDAINKYYSFENSNIHRGVHHLSQEATNAYEVARKTMQQFINAKHDYEVIFTKGTTDSINLVANCFSRKYLAKGDEVLITAMEHHSNIVPWQMACESTGASLKVIPFFEDGSLDMAAFEQLLTDKTKIVAVTHVSNTLGTINPVKEIIEKAHEKGAKVLVDGAQAVPHLQVDVQDLDCDFYAFSGHKMYGPTGIGVLYGKEDILNDLPPYQGGGDMIKTVTFEKTTYNELPFKYEAGTPNIAGGIVMKKAVEFIWNIGYENIAKHEEALLTYATGKLKQISGLKIIGEAKQKASVISFVVDGTHPTDVGTIIDKLGIAVRTGHHCTEPIMQHYKIPGTIRASFAIYNTKEEIDNFIAALERAVKMLKG